ncbi:MAG TPA: hypothetical protein VMU84_09040, partial [Thermoanaerobaculia bacterium]|nr:hypothetical protein [Thermoanaerobaculia bacterium]
AKTIRGGSDDKPYLTDGQYVDTNEPIGAIFMIEAKDMDEAVQIALKHPGGYVGRYFGGGIEVRAFDHFEEMPRG